MNPSIEKALEARRESKYIEFKAGFDPRETGEWCELIKDFAAIANSGGGVVLIGADNRGAPSGADLTAVLELDPATFVDKFQRYTDSGFVDFDLQDVRKDGRTLVAIKVGPSFPPIVFTKPGTYSTGDRRQKSAFAQGTVYFRHGAKSEPAKTEDLGIALERELEKVRKGWLADVAKVVKAPAGSEIAVLPAHIRHADSPDERPIQIVNDPEAPAYRVVNYDETHPFRAKEAVAEIRRRLPDHVRFNGHDLVCIRRVHNLERNEEYIHNPKFGSMQYSQSFVDWVVSKYNRDEEFFDTARHEYRFG